MKFQKPYCINLLILFFSYQSIAQSNNIKIEPVNFSNVTVTDAFWKPKMDLVATKTLAACIYQTEEKTARIRNFEKVARKKGEQHEGVFYDDSDVFKAIEAMSYSIKTNKDKNLEAKADEWIDKIAAAQLEDGYLNTYYTLTGLDKRWTDMSMHEDYNAGHMIEAAVAYYDATGNKVIVTNGMPNSVNTVMTNPIIVVYQTKASPLAQYPVIKQAGLLLLTHLYNNRSNTVVNSLSEIPFGVAQLLRPYKSLVM